MGMVQIKKLRKSKMGKVANIRRFEESEACAFHKNLRISPSKLKLVADFIRGRDVEEAINQLKFSKKRISGDVLTILNSAISNAENNHGLDIDNLYISQIDVGKSITMKRFRPRARGRVGRIKKLFSNIRIVVKEKN